MAILPGGARNVQAPKLVVASPTPTPRSSPPVTLTLRQPRASNKLHELQNSFGIVGREWILPVWRFIGSIDGLMGKLVGMRPGKTMECATLEDERRKAPMTSNMITTMDIKVVSRRHAGSRPQKD